MNTHGLLHIKLSTVLVIFLAFPMAASSVERSDESNRFAAFSHRHQFGGRIGLWSNNGDSPVPIGPSQPFYDTDFSEGNFYLEGFFSYRITSRLLIESSLGVVSRGDVTLIDSALQFTSTGNLILYPILVKAKLYPFTGISGRFRPYFLAGGGIYYAKQTVQFANVIIFNPSAFEDSETDFNYVLGGGFDYPVSSAFSLNFNAQYFPIKFNNELITIRNYKAFVATVGLTYLIPLGSKK